MSVSEYWRMVRHLAWRKARRTLRLLPTVRLVLSLVIGGGVIIALWVWGTKDAAGNEMIARSVSAVIVLALPFVWLWNCATIPASLHNDLTKRIEDFEEALKPKIDLAWRYSAEFAEIVLTNISYKSLPRIELSFRNYRKADGSDITDIICPMLSVDEKGPKIQLDPGVQTYFRFATTATGEAGEFIQLTPSGRPKIEIRDKEIGVKLLASGENIIPLIIEFRLALNEDESLSIEPWEAAAKAVNPGVV